MDSVIAKKQKTTITKIEQQSQGNKDIFQLFFELIFQYVGGEKYFILSTVSKAWQRYYSMVMNDEKLTSVADCMGLSKAVSMVTDAFRYENECVSCSSW